MKIALTFQKRNPQDDPENYNLKRIIAVFNSTESALDTLALIASDDTENYTIGDARYDNALGIYRIQRVDALEIKRGWICRTSLITDNK